MAGPHLKQNTKKWLSVLQIRDANYEIRAMKKSLAPRSLFDQEEIKTGSIQIENALSAGLTMFRALRSGMSFKDAIKECQEKYGKVVAYDGIRYEGKVLFVPVSELLYVKISHDGWELLESADVEDIILRYAQSGVAHISKPLSKIDSGDVKKVLINTENYLGRGDYIIQSIIVTALRESYPDAEITVVNKFPDLLKNIEKVSVVRDRHEITESIDDFDLVIDLDSLSNDWFYSGSANKIIYKDTALKGYAFVDNENNERKRILNVSLDSDRDFSFNYYDYYNTLIRGWGLKSEKEYIPAIAVSDDETVGIRSLLEKLNVLPNQSENNFIVVFNPLSSIKEKELGIEDSLRICRMLLALLPENAVIIIKKGDPKNTRHQKLTNDIQELINVSDIDSKRVKVIPYSLSYRQLMSLIAISNMVIGVDTSISHIAHSFSKETVTIFLKSDKMLTVYDAPVEWVSPTEKSHYVEVDHEPEDTFIKLNRNDYENIEALCKVLESERKNSLEEIFITNTIPDKVVRDFIVFINELVEKSQNEKINDLAVYINTEKNIKVLRAILNHMKENFRVLYAHDLDIIRDLDEAGISSAGLSGYIRSLNIVKYAAALDRYLTHQFYIVPRNNFNREVDSLRFTNNDA